MSHINYSFNQDDDSLPRDKMKLRNIASTRYSGDWPSIPHSHSYAELFYIVDGAGQFQINDRLFPVRAHQLGVVNPNVIHTEVSLESHPLEYIVLGIEGLEFTISDTSGICTSACTSTTIFPASQLSVHCSGYYSEIFVLLPSSVSACVLCCTSSSRLLSALFFTISSFGVS